MKRATGQVVSDQCFRDNVLQCNPGWLRDITAVSLDRYGELHSLEDGLLNALASNNGVSFPLFLNFI